MSSAGRGLDLLFLGWARGRTHARTQHGSSTTVLTPAATTTYADAGASSTVRARRRCGPRSDPGKAVEIRTARAQLHSNTIVITVVQLLIWSVPFRSFLPSCCFPSAVSVQDSFERGGSQVRAYSIRRVHSDRHASTMNTLTGQKFRHHIVWWGGTDGYRTGRKYMNEAPDMIKAQY